MIDLKRLSEDIHYQLIPQDGGNSPGWDVRILETFPETVIRFGNVEIDGEAEQLKYSMDIISSPDADLTLDDLTLQEFCGRILSSIIEDSLAHDEIVMTDKNTGEVMASDENMELLEEMYDEYQSGTDDTEELADK